MPRLRAVAGVEFAESKYKPLTFVRRAGILASVCIIFAVGCGSEQPAVPEQVAPTTQVSPAQVETAEPVVPTSVMAEEQVVAEQIETAEVDIPESDEKELPVTEPTSTTSTTAPTIEPIPAPEPVLIDPGEGWELVWHDEFDGETIDRSDWAYDIGGWGWGNGEAQYYTSRPENARLENGLLVIEARQEKYEDSYYTSARLKTQGLREFQYGRFEARLKVPAGAGLWPAFWMLGANHDRHSDDEDKQWPFVGEIDIMEYIGREPDLILGTLHGPGYSGALGLTKWNRQDYEIADDFHTYAIEWDEEGISWFYDGELYYSLTRESVGKREWVFDHEFFIILNLAIGGQFPGPISLDLEFPVFLYVDYVRVYQPID